MLRSAEGVALLNGRDQREGGTWSAAQAAKNHVIYAAVRIVLGALAAVPSRALAPLGKYVGEALYRVGLSRATALRNLALTYPSAPQHEQRALARASYRLLGSYLGAAVAQLRGVPLEPLAFEAGSRDVLDRALDEGRGAIFATAHLGPWEQVGATLVDAGFPLTTLAREAYDPRFMRLYDRLRGNVGVRAIYRGQPMAPFQIVRTLRKGGLLGVPMDLRSRVASLDVPFLGVPAPTPVGPARLALRTGAVVVVGTVVPAAPHERHGPGGSRLALRVRRIQTDDLAPDPAGERALLGRLNDELSSRIREFPEGWVWMHPRWSPPPKGRAHEKSAPSSRETR